MIYLVVHVYQSLVINPEPLIKHLGIRFKNEQPLRSYLV